VHYLENKVFKYKISRKYVRGEGSLPATYLRMDRHDETIVNFCICFAQPSDNSFFTVLTYNKENGVCVKVYSQTLVSYFIHASKSYCNRRLY